MTFNKVKPFLLLGGLYIILSFILRIVLINHPITTSSFQFIDYIKIFGLGLINDILVFVVASSLFVIYLLFLSDSKFKSPFGYIIFGALLVLLAYILWFPNNVFKQYGGSVVQIASIFVGLKAFLFGILLFSPKKRQNIRNILYFISLFIFVLLIIFNATSEYFFWNEFGVRYNFIAVDYLIYTNEVIGNILESYPIIPLFTIIFALSLGLTIFIYKKTSTVLKELPSFGQKILLFGAYIILFAVSIFIIPFLDKIQSENNFTDELQANGIPKFYHAFVDKQLDFDKFYPTLSEQKALQVFKSELESPEFPIEIKSDSTELRKNVVLISIESLSADFLSHYGNTKKITPFLDSLATKSLMFTNVYATGNRTVRGLEALTLCIPPTPGESVIKRTDNKNKFSTGSVFKEKGYQVKYLYGGYSYFDNMKDFFQGNGYDIVDRDQFAPNEISFANVWGVCDEDMAKKAIQVMNEEAKTGKPFFNHWMTVSNHRPFTYPEGKIDISGKSKSRDGGVKYTDYALKKFFEMAKKQSWYKNTVFVIASDHCASSAGKTELPLDKYRILGMVFSEDFIKPEQNSKLMSQIDIMPTLLGLLNFNYQSKFIGQDVRKENYKPRAFIATYQDLGLIKDNVLTIISPTKKVKQYDLVQQNSNLPEAFKLFYDQKPIAKIQNAQKEDCIAAYQVTCNFLKNNKLNR